VKPTWLDVVSVTLLAAGLVGGAVEHTPAAAPWAIAFAVYVLARMAKDAFATWREENVLTRNANTAEVVELRKLIEQVNVLGAEVKAERERLAAAYASLEADVRAIQGQTNLREQFGIPPLNFGPSLGPTRGT
jgi:uncharacterized protein YlxW (UPF0749 family)